MKRLLYILISAMLLPAAYAGIHAQEYTPVPVTVSKEKVKVDGKVYYSHIVLERQTLYSICKAYNVTQEQVFEANPTVRTEGLKKNAVLLIPVQEPVQEVQVQQVPDNAQDRKSGKKAAREERKQQTIHTVRWYEDLDVIAGKYGVTVEAIMQENGLTGRKLKKRQKLVIPDMNDMARETETEAPDTAAVADSMVMTDGQTLFPARKDGKVEIVLMLPFNSAAETPKSGSIDFYCGTLMAVKEAGDAGYDIDLSVYDVWNGELPITEERLGKSDIVIGPVSPGDLSRLLVKCPSGTNVVSPLDHKAEYLSDGHANFIQAPASALTQYEDLAKWIREEQRTGEKVIVIYEKGARNMDELGAMNSILEKDGITFHSFSYSILEGRDIQRPLKEMMTTEAANRVLVMSESEAFVNDVVRNLNLLIHDEYDIVLYGPSKIRSFETIEVDNLHNTRLHTSLAYYVDYDSAEVRDFVSRYRALYSTEPTPYAFQGYDIASYFLELCTGHDGEWIQYLEENDRSLLQTDLKFRKTGENDGYVNTGVRRIVYGEDYTVSLVR